ncbi:sensor histidine kinase [Aggregatilinea lenta]|uniref:sensor histidine kinase n=1 Tax=Aggregatilinea lenta TaxID=913108 RepID=UPI000E5ABDC8|nr:ATP-binding protein [Aggregatilinea lenta]
MKLRLTSLPLQLLVFVVLPLLILLVIVAFGGVALHQAEMRDMLVDHNRQAVSGAAGALSGQLVQRQHILASFASEVVSRNPQDVLDTARWIPVLFDGGAAVFEDGRLVAASSSQTGWQALADQVMEPTGPALVPLVRDGQNTTRVMFVSPAQNIRVAGVVSLGMLTSTDVLESLHTSGSIHLYVLSSEGRILYHSDPSQVGRYAEDVASQVADTTTTTAFERKDSEGRDVIATSAPVPAAGWVLVQEERWQETLSPLMRYSQAAPLALVPGLLIAIGAVWLGIQRIVYPLRRLEAQATELAWGDFAAIERSVGGIAEIRHLQGTLQHMTKRVQAAQASMHNYIGAITQAQEDERRRLARELHDQTAQALVALDHREQMLKPYLKGDPAASDLLSEIRAMIVEIIDDLRRIVRALRPIYLEELGLAPALQMLARDLGLVEKMDVHFEKSGSPQRLLPEHEIAMYRIAQEALNNAWQHSEASQIWLTVQFASDQVTITVRDDGKGFTAPRYTAELDASGQRHFGIMGMYERAALIGAHLQVKSEPGDGTTITVRAPIETPPDDKGP